MVSLKKKRTGLSKCEKCSCYILSRDLETHAAAGDACEPKLGGNLAHIRPSHSLTATTSRVDGARNAQLPSDALGWSRYNTVLVHPETLELLGVLARSACLLVCDHDDATRQHIVSVWPSTELSPLKIDVGDLERAERIVMLRVVSETREISRLHLSAESEIETRLLEAEHFAHYLNVYLAGAFVSPALPLQVHYLARCLTFHVEESDEHRLARCSLNNDQDEKDALPSVYTLDRFTISLGNSLR